MNSSSSFISENRNRFYVSVLAILSLLGTSCVPGTYLSDINSDSRKTTVSNKNNISDVNGVYEYAFFSSDDPVTRKLIIDNFYSPEKYIVGRYDRLEVIVWNHPELSNRDRETVTPILVDSDGEIFFPMIGKIRVEGKSIDQIRQILKGKLDKYLYDSQIAVNVVSFNSRSVHIIGEIMKPGISRLTDVPLTVLQAINEAGGTNPNSADTNRIYVVRGNKDNKRIQVYVLDTKTPQSLVAVEKFRLLNDDIVYVPPTKLTNWNRVINQILPTLQTVWYATTTRDRFFPLK